MAARSKSLSPTAETLGTVNSASGPPSETSFEHCFSQAALEQEFRGLCRSHLDVFSGEPRIATGADKVSLELFQRDLGKHISALSRKAIDGRYTFSPLKERDIPKPGGGNRTISISAIRDAVCQRALYNHLYHVIDAQLLPCVCGYRRGMGVHSAVAAVRSAIVDGANHVLDADIQKFFDNVDHELLMAKVDQTGLDPRARQLIFRFLKTPGAATPSSQTRGTRRTIGVPQGGVISGLLTNLFLADFDRVMQSAAPGYVRYADDFVVCSDSAENAREAEQAARSALTRLKLNLHGPPKTVIRTVQQGFDFVGFRIDDKHVRIRDQNLAKFKNRVMSIIHKHKPRRDADSTLTALVSRLRPKIEGPSPEILEQLVANGLLRPGAPRSWVGFFSIITDDAQIKDLDKWIRAQISAYIWRAHQSRVKLTMMQKCGLPSLQANIWDARKSRQPEARNDNRSTKTDAVATDGDGDVALSPDCYR